MTWNPKKRRSPAQRQHVQSNLRKIHPPQDDKENMSPAADLDSSAAASSSASDALASHAVQHEAQLSSQSGASTLDQGTMRWDLHNTRRRERRLRDTKEALQHQLKELKQAEGHVLDAETQAEMVEIQLEDTVGRMRMEMQIRDTQCNLWYTRLKRPMYAQVAQKPAQKRLFIACKMSRLALLHEHMAQ
ncbi:hypothetical protein BC628DRAFT_1339483 [Trametes gibbosa]|nr:hypothetical protein BC628DRAFT_1339483 [Trametes gibbosa]